MAFGLTYNSAIYDVRTDYEQFSGVYKLTSRLAPSATGGGWNYSHNYSVADELIPNKTCSTSPKVERLYTLFPDGSRHILHLYNNFVFDDNGDGGSPYYPNGAVACANTVYSAITSGNLTYFTTDGTFVKLVIPANPGGYWTNSQWSMYLPDGRVVYGYGYQTIQFADHYANFYVNNLYQGVTWPQTLLGDFFGRAIQLHAPALILS